MSAEKQGCDGLRMGVPYVGRSIDRAASQLILGVVYPLQPKSHQDVHVIHSFIHYGGFGGSQLWASR
jgi:hypothetical protein